MASNPPSTSDAEHVLAVAGRMGPTPLESRFVIAIERCDLNGGLVDETDRESAEATTESEERAKKSSRL